MSRLIPFLNSHLAKITNHRSGEIKFGEKMHTIPKDENIENYLAICPAKYVVIGIPEDIGIRANFGRLNFRASGIGWHVDGNNYYWLVRSDFDDDWRWCLG